MNDFFEWFGRHRKTIGYTVGVMNLLSGINYFAHGQTFSGILWIILGAAILFDTKEYK